MFDSGHVETRFNPILKICGKRSSKKITWSEGCQQLIHSLESLECPANRNKYWNRWNQITWNPYESEGKQVFKHFQILLSIATIPHFQHHQEKLVITYCWMTSLFPVKRSFNNNWGKRNRVYKLYLQMINQQKSQMLGSARVGCSCISEDFLKSVKITK